MRNEKNLAAHTAITRIVIRRQDSPKVVNRQARKDHYDGGEGKVERGRQAHLSRKAVAEGRD